MILQLLMIMTLNSYLTFGTMLTKVSKTEVITAKGLLTRTE